MAKKKVTAPGKPARGAAAKAPGKAAPGAKGTRQPAPAAAAPPAPPGRPTRSRKAAAGAPGKAAPTAPPPARTPRGKGQEPPGGVLVWTKHGADTWLAPDPGGDVRVAGARIRMFTDGYKDRPGEARYSVYRDSKYLGSDPTLEAAQRRAQYREESAQIYFVNKDGTPVFLLLTSDERRKSRDSSPLPPETKKSWKPRAEEVEDPTLKKALQEREALTAAKNEARAAKQAARVEARFSDDAVIKLLVDKNPRKPGTGAHARFALLMEHDGKTVGQFRAAKGNMETLENAAGAKRVEVTEKE